MEILFIGNSYTYYNDLEVIFEKLCRENGLDVNAQRVTCPGRRLHEFTLKEDETTLKLEALIKEKKFDTVFIQEQSLLPAKDFDKFMFGVNYVTDLISVWGAKLIFYATWARKEGSPDYEALGWTPEEMTDLLQSAYEKAALKFDAPVSPVGVNFLKVSKADPSVNLYDDDMTHPSYLGSCLAAMTHFYTLFGYLPEKTDSLALNEGVVSAFKKVICE